ncbi:MAG: N-acetylneuraminate synthase [Gammaproteobacteria bacterium]|jgi:sialic acid synthase SpsE|nr:N-acetylneuraminate synthase [Gammaproteobacteria bacterium]MBT4462015.1 N-acetylneuraminate synthase [Gammaproteobacteria bacterium]MBT4654527.1 N-acetylneuraminate synthase [Gammaproteobacteria bacterium]MBT5117139.1 N-acetylneuraminate synthase [Gammaproteobacteria bacterium]MBT5761468.1 N-acetylneuraminate synthase [Gammaproteobacteria bacterium]
MTKINKRPIHIIAEIGVNHNGKLSLAKKLIKEAKKSGANSVKFQTFNTDEIIKRNTSKAKYQIKNTNNKESQYDMLKRYELSNEDYKALIVYSKKVDIEFFSTACDIDSLTYLCKKLKLKTIKISSTDLTNIPLLLKAGATRKKIIISSGMADIYEIDIALSALSYGYAHADNLDISKFKLIKHKKYYLKNKQYLSRKVTLLHCTTEYPAPLDELNLNVITDFQSRYPTSIGYSDHSNNLLTPIVVTAKNITMIEVHVTLNTTMDGPDHKCSLDMKKFSEYVDNIRKTEMMLGSPNKAPTKSEIQNIKTVRKSLVLNKSIVKGEKITVDNLAVKRPGNGIPSIHYTDYINVVSKKILNKNHFLKKEDVKKK